VFSSGSTHHTMLHTAAIGLCVCFFVGVFKWLHAPHFVEHGGMGSAQRFKNVRNLCLWFLLILVVNGFLTIIIMCYNKFTPSGCLSGMLVTCALSGATTKREHTFQSAHTLPSAYTLPSAHTLPIAHTLPSARTLPSAHTLPSANTRHSMFSYTYYS
jgi:hypothetical protein